MNDDILTRIYRQSAHAGVLLAVQMVARLLLAVALGKGLSPTDFGTYSIIAATLGFAGYFVQLGAHHYYLRQVPGKYSLQGASIFKSVFLVQATIILALAALVLAVPGFASATSSFLTLEGHRGALFILVALVVTDVAAADFIRYLAAKTQIEQSNVVSFFRLSSWALVVFVLFTTFPRAVDLSLVITIWLGSLVLGTLYGFWRARPRELVRSPFHPSLYVQAVKFGFPLMFTSLSALFIELSDRFFILKYYTGETLGIYSFHYNIIAMVVAVSGPVIGNVLAPYAVEAYNRGQMERTGSLLSGILKYRLILVAPVLVAVALWGPEIVTLLARPSYARAGQLTAFLVPVPVLMILNGTFTRVLFLQNRTVVIARSYILAAILNLGLNFGLIPLHPYYGAAGAKVAGLLTLLVLLWYHGRSSDVRVNLRLQRLAIATGPAVLGGWFATRLLPTGGPLALVLLGGAAATVTYIACVKLFGVLSRSEEEAVYRLLAHARRSWMSSVRQLLRRKQ